jgi:plasmid stabilization system protein ParE
VAVVDIRYLPEAVAALDEILFSSPDKEAAEKTLLTIQGAISMLGQHPEIGRPVEDGRRELVISIGKTGYLALYRYRPDQARVLVVAIRHQRRAGYQSG